MRAPPSVDPVRVRTSRSLPQFRLLDANAVGDPLAKEVANLVSPCPPSGDGQRELVLPGADADGVALEGGVLVPGAYFHWGRPGQSESVSDRHRMHCSFDLLGGLMVGVA